MQKKWLWVLIAVLCLVVLAGALFMIQYNSYGLSLYLQGESVMAVEVGDTFDDPGAKAESYDWLRGERVASVRCQGTVDTATAGIYELTYEAEFHGIVRTASRQVHVVESLDPVITLQSNPEAYTLPGAEYVEEGYTATDWFDGDITHLVQRTVEDGKVLYTVTSSSGRSTTLERTIRYSDPTAPELILNEGDAITVYAGQPFQDPGFTATDNVDGDLTAQVEVNGYVDVHALGDYELTYTATDNWGNTTSAKRTVTVVPKDPNKVIYLTFDDGPGPYTEKLLNVLEEYGVKATFFLVNTDYIYLAERMAADGHSVGIHSINHNFSQIYSSDEAYFEDLYGMQAILEEYTGQTTYLFRFPGGSSNTISKRYSKGIMSRLTVSTQEAGFRYFDWNVDSRDASIEDNAAASADDVYHNVVSGISTRKSSIVLMHDIKGFSVAAVERIIIWGLSHGYTFLRLTEDSPTCAHGIAN